MFDHLKVAAVTWDGHTTEEKYARLAGLENDPQAVAERDRYRAALAEFYRRLERDARASVTEGCMYLFGAVPLDVVEAARAAAREVVGE